ncbi:MAG TPA: ABC transporter ATP-binding protein [Anaerolineae bacterium]|jgi:ABC-2 type transport system ATP-binding protein|nr:ABC transporter ATP-binding protein [Anaerolineae bacterium]
MSQLAIDAQGMRKEFGDKVAVEDFTLQVPKGEIFGFLGPNGAGKTTSVKMLLGLVKPTAGTANILGRPFGERATLARIGFLPEHFRFHEWLQAAEFLDLHGQLLGMEKSRRAAAIPPLLELVGLERRAKTKLSAFSKGMLQRIGLAQALLNEPELVFLDEPTSGLDPLGRRLVRDIITGLRAEKITVFLNSHLLSEIELTCDRVAFIREGVIVRVATLEELEQERIQITIRVGRPTQELVNGLAQYGDGVTLDESSGRIHLTIADESQMPQIVNWLVEQDQAVYELSPRRRSLEDRFLEIVGDEMYDS